MRCPPICIPIPEWFPHTKPTHTDCRRPIPWSPKSLALGADRHMSEVRTAPQGAHDASKVLKEASQKVGNRFGIWWVGDGRPCLVLTCPKPNRLLQHLERQTAPKMESPVNGQCPGLWGACLTFVWSIGFVCVMSIESSQVFQHVCTLSGALWIAHSVPSQGLKLCQLNR